MSDDQARKARYHWRAPAITVALDLYDEDGQPDDKKVYRLYEAKRLHGVKKVGRELVGKDDELGVVDSNSAAERPAG
jgi:hypothetical protein